MIHPNSSIVTHSNHTQCAPGVLSAVAGAAVAALAFAAAALSE